MSIRQSLDIGELAAGEGGAAREWDAFVRDRPAGTIFHLAGWKEVVESALGHRAHYLAARRAGELVGVLPLVHVRSRLFGDALISNAFCVYGGPLGTRPEVERELDEAAIALAKRLGVGHLEYRLREARHGSWVRRDGLYATFRKAIAPSDEANLKAIPRKQRAMVRKAIANGLASTVEPDIETFYRLFAESVRNLGTPVYARRYMRRLLEVFGENCEVLVVRDGHRPVAGVLSFYFRDEVAPYYGGGTPAARALAANDFMYWEVMRRARARGCRVFDFGRSKLGTGAYAFKKNWGFAPRPLVYEHYLVRADAVPETNPLNPKYRLAIAVWRRLPLVVANRLGPAVSRGIG